MWPIVELKHARALLYSIKLPAAGDLLDAHPEQAVPGQQTSIQFPDAHPLFHSDRGFQYTSKIFRKKLDDAGMRQSMSRVGRCIDNGPMEGFWGILKSEMYYLWKFTDEQELWDAIESYILFYNTRRYQRRLGCMTPMEFHAAAT